MAEREGLFHPNCKHAINAIIPELASLTKSYDNNLDTITASELEKLNPKHRDYGKAPSTDKDYTVYRGTGKKTAMHDLNSYGTGTYYSLDRDYAEVFGKVKKSTLTLTNPLILKTQEDVNKATLNMIESGYDSLSDWAKKQGHDSIIDKQTNILLKL
jgi:hypothetical protein